MHSKEDILKYAYGIDKAAAGPIGVTGAGAAAIKLLTGGASSAVETSAQLLIAALAGTAAVGGGIGWAAAKLMSHTPEDIDLAKKEYQNERLKSDIGYLSGQLRQERDAMQSKQDPKPARVVAL